jgi:enoyl-[acyl-carrier protein] reductase II
LLHVHFPEDWIPACAGTIHQHEARYRVEEFRVGALRKAVVDGDVENGSLMAGRSVGLVDKIQPMAEIMEELVRETDAELQKVKSLLGG